MQWKKGRAEQGKGAGWGQESLLNVRSSRLPEQRAGGRAGWLGVQLSREMHPP